MGELRMVHRFGLDAVLRAREPGDAADLEEWMQVARREMLGMLHVAGPLRWE